MYWENIQGWFTFDFLYSNMVEKFKDDAIFVEIGTWKGKSAIFMAEKIKNSKKKISFYTIDLFENNEKNDHSNLIDVNDLFLEAQKNINPVKDFVKIIKGSSHEIHKDFKDESIDFLFIDGCHTYEGVKKDLQLWYPKVKKGGVISGHDYNEITAGIKPAVDEFFKFAAKPYSGGCWYLEK